MGKVMKYLFLFLLFANVCLVAQPQKVTREQLLKLFYQANMAKNNNKIDEAIDAYKQIIALSPKLSDSYMQLGNVYAMKVNDISALQNACACYDKYLILNPDASNASTIKNKITELKATIEQLKKMSKPVVAGQIAVNTLSPKKDTTKVEIPTLPTPKIHKDTVLLVEEPLMTSILSDTLKGRWVSASLGQNGREEWIFDLIEEKGKWCFALNDSSFIKRKNSLLGKISEKSAWIHSVDNRLVFSFVVKDKKKERRGNRIIERWESALDVLFGEEQDVSSSRSGVRDSDNSLLMDSMASVEPIIEHSYLFDLAYDGFKFVGSVLYKVVEKGPEEKLLNQYTNECELFKAPNDYLGFSYVPLVSQEQKAVKLEFRDLLNRKLSESGTSVSAVNDLGCMYASGIGIRSNMKMAVAYFMEASMKKNLFAMLNMAQLYQDGIGVEKDVEKARNLYMQAYEQGYTDAMVMCGDTYLISMGENGPDYNKAFDCYLKAVYKRCPYAFYRLGWLYREGLGTEKNVDKAWEYYQRALNMQYSDAMTDVGIFYRYGEMGVEPDYEKAVEWLNKAADKGNAKAMYELADMYLRGEGVKPDFKYAKNWYLKALRAEDKIVDGFNTVKSQIRAILNPKKE